MMIDTRAPYMVRAIRSRPEESVPNTCGNTRCESFISVAPSAGVSVNSMGSVLVNTPSLIFDSLTTYSGSSADVSRKIMAFSSDFFSVKA